MALTATATQGFETVGKTTGDEIFYIPGDPGDTYTQGNQVVATVGEGVIDPLAANEGGAVGTVTKTIACPANTTAMPLCTVDVSAPDYNGALIPIKMNVPAGLDIFRVTFANHYDDTVASYSAASRYIGLTTGCGADDRPAGALVYVYEGTGAGQVNIVESYDHTGGTVELMLVLHRAFSVDLSTDSKVIIVSGEAAGSRGVGFFNRAEAAGASSLTVNQGADDGDYVVFMDFREAATYLKDLTLRVIPARYLMLA